MEPTSICQGCHAGCCRAFAVPITGADVLRISRATGLSFWDFACRWEDRAGQIAGDYAPHLYFADDPGTPFTLCLLHETSRQFPDTSKCRLLDESPLEVSSPGASRCGVYADRPMACRVFPLRTNTSGPLAVLGDLPEQGRAGDSQPAYRLCPRPWEPADVDPLQAPQDLAVSAYEADFFRQVAMIWNQRPGDWRRFPEFLQLVYEQRVIRETPSAIQMQDSDAATLPFPTGDNRSRRVA